MPTNVLIAGGGGPAALDELGVGAAIEGLADRVASRHGVAVAADVRLPAGSRYPAEVETALYRIVQEGLTNAARHSGAQRLEIRISEAGTQIAVALPLS
jgi:signal transduction histidine kinase